MRTAGKFFGGRRVELEPIDFAPQVVRLEVSVGFRRDPRIAVTEIRCTAPGFTPAIMSGAAGREVKEMTLKWEKLL